ncbi:MAG: TonB-dependent receptor, partial [Saprospiraceae bacterium]|nr:TonB-dependent receptor [Saprospiraceae bacterium]
ISPEQSNNYNLGFIFNNRNTEHSWILSLNTFIRDAKDFIIPVVQGIKVNHMNNGQVLSKGIDLGLGYTYRNKWVLAINGTYLDLRDNNPWRNGQVGVENTLYKVRLPNIPYLFGNMSLSYRSESLFISHDQYSISISQNYVHDFFFRWENLASQDKGVVPSQFTTNLEFVYSYLEEKYNLSFAIVNLWDTEVYDNFQQLRPGRNYNLKLRYFINK